MQERDEYGQFAGSRGGGRGGNSRDDDDNRGSSPEGGRGGRGGEYVDWAGRHYTRESWERAQEGRALGGQHSHGGGRGGSRYD
jgi:hypothetical protein